MPIKATRGVIFVHSCTPALCPHVEWAVENVLKSPVSFEWTEQPAQPGTYRAEAPWIGSVGTGAEIASTLRGWEHLRYEVTEDAAPGTNGGRWSHTPDLGIFHAQTDALGSVVVNEERVRAALEFVDDPLKMRRILDLALGTAWDEELEPFRYAGAEAPIRYLHRVG
ncbi:MAG: DUF3145 domain-containing protein [Varibaculum sp.]|nr:DUF3145 domain-containing protein [Varibaculum sp.]